MNTDISDLTDYPPRLLIQVEQNCSNSSSPEVQVKGLNRECSFRLLSFSSGEGNNICCYVNFRDGIRFARDNMSEQSGFGWIYFGRTYYFVA